MSGPTDTGLEQDQAGRSFAPPAGSAPRTCATCKWWSPGPIPINPPTTEHLCLRSKRTDFGAYGQDGKAIITHRTFGCNEWQQNAEVSDGGGHLTPESADECRPPPFAQPKS